MDLERERGITIMAKNTAVRYREMKINIVDTPGHADFGGEVERVLKMVDGVMLLVDAAEGCLPQTRSCCERRSKRDCRLSPSSTRSIGSDARPAEVVDEIYELFLDLDATNEQIEFPILYAVSREGMAKKQLEDESRELAATIRTDRGDDSGAARAAQLIRCNCSLPISITTITSVAWRSVESSPARLRSAIRSSWSSPIARCRKHESRSSTFSKD